MQPCLLDGAPPDTQGTCTPNGWTSALDYASKNNDVISSLAPNTTHKMQSMGGAIYGPLKTYFEWEVKSFQKSHPGRIRNQYDVARLLSPAFLKSAVAQNAVHGFERQGISPVNMLLVMKITAGVIVVTSYMNISTERTIALETIDIPRPFAETSSTPSPPLLQEHISSNSVDPLSEIVSYRNRTPSCEFPDFVAPIVNTLQKIRSNGCTSEPKPGYSRIFSAFGPDIISAAQKGDTVVPETKVNIRQTTSRDNSPDPKLGCSASHYSPWC
ncbi:hypothetical protein WA026_002906 [Henosepilachna vigintioctopunctata]|uniref:Uncharacterized protein n=1 Tax=Henosepilachna vigintioctopunctata TaxID=420089 RepID=A0AAW1TKZ9_9CUCU